MKIGHSTNEYGTAVSVHICDTCGDRFTVCPEVLDEAKFGGNCLAPSCPSYDESRDVDKMFEQEPERVRCAPIAKA